MKEKNLFIHAVDMVEFKAGESIPTAIQYRPGGEVRAGADAVVAFDSPAEVNEDFKIDLGKIKVGQSPNTRRQFPCGDGASRSAYNIAADFFGSVISYGFSDLKHKHISPAKNILVSEPLHYIAENDEDWLENYRGNMRRILRQHFDSIQFLPEPFAVYQYYRYGVKHSLVANARKHCAMVVDFGGGTFDVSVVETTALGDISKSGRHSRPLGASSTPVGGFEVNRQWGRRIIELSYGKSFDRERLRKGVDNYFRWRSGDLDIDSLNVENRRFVKWYGRLLRDIEKAKLELSGQILNWSLEARLAEYTTIYMPSDPYSDKHDLLPFRITAEELRGVVANHIWDRRLKRCIRNVLEISKTELNGRPIDLALISGGSSNLRWVEFLLKRDFSEELSGCNIISLRENYQEVVAKGLAIECARRGYEPNSEFSDVFYNPLYLLLESDGRGHERPRYRLVKSDVQFKGDPTPGQLIGAADYLDVLEQCEITWKFRLRHPPKRFLDYFFLKELQSSLAVDERYNYVETRLHTPVGTKFSESSIRVRLQIREDGTCTPTFIYSTDEKDDPAQFVSGNPFCIDLVSANQAIHREAFIGLDFGTATSAISYVDWGKIEAISAKQESPQWLGLAELIDLPMPVSAPLKAYIGASRVEDQAKLAMEALEAMLCFSAYICWAERAALPNKKSAIFNRNWKRSAGPLKKLLFDCVDAKGQAPHFGSHFRRALDKDTRAELSQLINTLDRVKHGKAAEGAGDPKSVLERLGNSIRTALSGWSFGYFENLRAKGFSRTHVGTFRVANGTPPFHETLRYEGKVGFSDMEAVLVNPELAQVLTLTPLIFWMRLSSGVYWQDCLIFDGINRDGKVEYKVANSHQCSEPEESDLVERVGGLSTGETSTELYKDCEFQRIQDR